MNTKLLDEIYQIKVSMATARKLDPSATECPDYTDMEDQLAILREQYIADLKSELKALFTDATLELTLCGTWLWVAGETKPVKDRLKEHKFRWSPDKKMWYLPGEKSLQRHKSWAFEKIKERHGDENIVL